MPTQKGVIQGSHQQAQWKITKREQRAQRHERPETGMSVHAFLSLEYRTPLRIRLEMNGKKEGTVEGLMRKRCKTSGPHNELWAQQLAMADTCCNRKKCKPSIYKPELALPPTFSTNLEKTRNPAYGCLTNPASSKQQTSNHTISQPAKRSQQDQSIITCTLACRNTTVLTHYFFTAMS